MALSTMACATAIHSTSLSDRKVLETLYAGITFQISNTAPKIESVRLLGKYPTCVYCLLVSNQ